MSRFLTLTSRSLVSLLSACGLGNGIGDLGDVTAYASECWSTSFERVYYTDSTTGGTGSVEGDAGECAYPEAEYADAAR